MRSLNRSVSFALSLISAIGVFARTVTVPGDYADIQSAVNDVDPTAGDPIDTISVAAGTYEISNWIVVDKPVTISGAGRDRTIITNTTASVVGDRSGCVLYLNHVDAVVEGVTLAGGRFSRNTSVTPASGGWGAYVSSGTLQDARVANCRGGYGNANDKDGAAVNMNGTSAKVLRTIIENNVRTDYNTAVGAGLRIDRGTASGCLIVNNCGGSGAGVYMTGSDSHLVNCTVAKNRLGSNLPNYHGGGLYSNVSTGATVSNCVFALNGGNDGGTVGGDEWSAANAGTLASAMSHCAVLGGEAIGTDAVQLSVDPFVDAANGDFTIRLGAPCTGMGCADPRPAGMCCGITADHTVVICGSRVGFAGVVYGTNGTETVAFAWSAKDGAGNPVDLGLSGEMPSAVLPTSGRYTVHVEAKVDGGAWIACPYDFPVLVGAPTNYVTAVENPKAEPPYDTPETAGNDLQAVIDAAVDGAVVSCAAGTYVLLKQVEIVKPIRVVGAGIGKSVLSGYDPVKKTNGERLVFMNHADAVLEGFTLSDTVQDRDASLMPSGYEGTFLGGWAAYVMTGTMRSCRVTNCKGSYGNQNNRNGAAVNLGSPNAFLSHCVLDGNVRTGLNTALGCALLLDGGQADNCLICGNEYGIGVGVYVATAGSRLLNCTVADNATKSSDAKYKGGGLYFANVDSCRIENCLFARNSSSDGGEGAGQWYAADRAKLDAAMKNCAFLAGSALGEDPVSLAADPFADADNGDYHLKLGTPARDNGCMYAEMAETDLEGNPRVVEEKVDIGCYQFVSSGLICDITVDKSAVRRGDVVRFGSDVEGAKSSVQYAWSAKDESGAAVDLGLAGAAPSWTSDRYGHFTVHLRVSEDGAQWYDSASDVRLAVNAWTNYVTVSNANAAFPWNTPETAATNVQEVIDEALEGNVIRFAAGQYPIREQLYIDRGVTLLGAGVDKTVLSNAVNVSGGHRLVCLNHKDAQMDGFTLTHGHGDDYQNSGSLGQIVGGWGIYIQAGTFANGRVTDCSCDWMNETGENGAAVNLQTTNAVLTHCIVDNNRRSGCNTAQGAGVRIVGGKVDNCLIYGNVGAYGAGISLCGSKAEVWNCTVVSNDAMSALSDEKTGGCGGGIGIQSVSFGQSVAGSKVWNCIFAFNKSRLMNKDTEVGGGEWGVSAGSRQATAIAALGTIVTNCAFYKGPETGNAEPIGGGSFSIGADEFRNPDRLDFRLRRTAKCVDAGIDDGWKEGNVDFLGARRKVCGRVDLGCYENQQHGMMLIVR